MKKYTAIKYVLFILMILSSCKDINELNYSVRSIQDLKEYNEYEISNSRDFPEFLYQEESAPELKRLRNKYNLDAIAGKGTDLERAINLLKWTHEAIPHEDEYNLQVLNAVTIIETYKNKGISQGCYPIAITFNEVLLSMGYKARIVICFPKDFNSPNGGHVINTVFIPSLNKWAWMDAQENAYLVDENRQLLSIQEVRERLILSQKLILNKDANYHGEVSNIKYYLEEFMSPFLYRFISPINSEYNSETRDSGKILTYVELLPLGPPSPPKERQYFETKEYKVVTYHTNNAKLFWEVQ